MKSILKTRLMLWKKSKVSLIFWLLMPIVVTIGVIYTGNLVKEDARIPVGIVIEEETPMVKKLVTDLKNSPLLQINIVNENQAKQMVESHELDSAFVIKKGYEENIRTGNRSKLIIGYESDLSFAYTVTRETILSLVQRDSGRAKTVQTVHNLSNHFDENFEWSEEEIIEKALEIESEQNLLNSKFVFSLDGTETTERTLLIENPWTLWSIFSLLAMFLLVDWVIKEKESYILIRLPFTRFQAKVYFLLNLLLYFCLFLLIDLLTMIFFHYLFNVGFSLEQFITLFTFRLTGTLLAFSLAISIRKLIVYYALSFIISLLITITSGAILPMNGLTERFVWMELLNPIRPFLFGELWNPWILIFICFISLWFMKGEKQNASIR